MIMSQDGVTSGSVDSPTAFAAPNCHGSRVIDAEFGRRYRQSRVCGPETQPGHERGGEQVRINPANAATVKSAVTHEIDHFMMRHGRRLMDEGVVCE